MTIVTKTNSDKKVEKPLVDDINTSHCTNTECSNEDVEAWLSPSTRRRVSTTTTVCGFIMALVVMSLGIIGGVYLYRQFAERRMARFQGWCGIPYERNDLHIVRNDRILGSRPYFKPREDVNAEWFADRTKLFKEEVDLDLDSDLHEEIFVPDFGLGRQGRFIHDFSKNKTGILDIGSKRCFVMPLDRKYILPPKSMLDVIRKMMMGYYNVDTSVVRRTMRISQPPIKDTEGDVGKFIAKHCEQFDTYNLVPVQEDMRKKRSLIDGDGPLTLAEFAGYRILEYTILESP